MPIPAPQDGESQDEFLERCLSDDIMVEEYSQDQRYAVCMQQWNEADKMSKVEKQVPIQKTDEEHQIVKGVVYAANYVDSDGETMTAEDVRKAAWDFLANNREKNIDISHNWQQSGCYVVESYVTEEADEYFPADSWIIAVKCTDDVWEQVKSGELNGFSFGGYIGTKYPQRVIMEVSKQIIGQTEENLNKDVIPAHSHNFTVWLDEKGNIVKGMTDEVQEHFHTVTYGTGVDMAVGHGHRISLEED